MNSLKLEVTQDKTLRVDYKSSDHTPIFDLCDYDGKLLDSGTLKNAETCLDIAKLNDGQYYLFILDGADIFSQKFAV